MTRSIVGSWMAPLLVTTLVLVAGCKGDAPPSRGDKAAEPATAQGAATETTAKPASPEGEKAPEAAKPAQGTEAATPTAPAAGGKAPTDKATLAKAYVEIYCAQRKKETERLLEIYTRYGFADPKSWTASWTEAAKDDAWVAEITQKAIQTCP